jgi:hypothetical protein
VTHKTALVLLAGLVLAFFFRVAFLGHVVFPHDNAAELGLAADENTDRLGSQRFTDVGLVYIPSVHQQLNGDRSGWLVTWDPHVELGKPANQLAGLGKAFLPMHVVSFLTNDALTAYTLMVVLAVLASALFSYLFFKELGLAPAACFVGAAGLGVGFFVGYWLTFGVFVWGIAWTMALLWGIERYAMKPGVGRFLWVAFAVHALFLSAYPQAIVWNAYIIVGYTLSRAFALRPTWGRRLALALALGAAALVGLASVAPVYLDLALEAKRSGRAELNPNFFVSALPKFESLADVGFYLRRMYDDLWYGNPVDHSHVHVRRGMKGLCFTPAFLGLFAACFAGGLYRRVWGWLLFVGVTAVMTVWPGLYTFGIEHLGLSFSRWLPLGAAWIPIMVLSAYSVDRIVREGERGRSVGSALAAVPALLALVGILTVSESPDWALVGVSMGLSLCVVLFVWSRKPLWVLVAVVAGTLHYGLRISLTRPPEEVNVESPIVDDLRTLTQGKRRYAVVDHRTPFLRPNIHSWLGLRTIHTYDSLSPREYREWAIRLNGEGDKIPGRTEWQLRKLLPSFGRVFSQIKPSQELVSPMLSYAGVSLVVSQLDLDVSGMNEVANGLYMLEREPLLEAQVVAYREAGPGEVTVDGFLPDVQRHSVERVRDVGDEQSYATTPVDTETVLFISQQLHPYWSARSGGRELETVRINGLYQGVRLPPGTSEVELRFLPLARWAWVPQLAFVLALIVCVVGGRSKQSSRI